MFINSQLFDPDPRGEDYDKTQQTHRNRQVVHHLHGKFLSRG